MRNVYYRAGGGLVRYIGNRTGRRVIQFGDGSVIGFPGWVRLRGPVLPAIIWQLSNGRLGKAD